MLVPVIVLLIALVVLLWWHALDGSMRALAERKGLPYDVKSATRTRWIIYGVMAVIVVIMFLPKSLTSAPTKVVAAPAPPVDARYTSDSLWYGPDTASIAGIEPQLAALVRYGRNLIANTASYLGPNGSVAHMTNGMNCQNCHLDAGTRPWGNNYGAVWSQYPKFRERSGSMESVVKRVNDCVERSLNGTALDSNSHEMQAILAYMQWVGTNVPTGKKPKGTGITEMKFLERAADPMHGVKVFNAKCITCHDADGQGKKNLDGITYQYPPLWGDHSYNIGAGLYRLSRFAGYVKANMPQGSTWDKPQLSDEDAWDVAAFINSQQRPDRDLSKDWPKITGKPVDHPFGPYADNFTEQQHKFGPFAEIKAAADARKAQQKK